MAWLETHVLSVIVFFPLLWGALGLLIPSRKSWGATTVHVWTQMGAGAAFFLSLWLYFKFSEVAPGFQFVEQATWIPSLGISYGLGVDGISLWFVLLTTLLTSLAVLGSFGAIQKRLKEYYFYLLVLETAMVGAFVATDLFLFYVFWEAMLVPMVLLIGIWGGKARIYAATKFLIYTAVGSLLMLVAIFYLAYQHQVQFGQLSTAITDLYRLRFAADGFLSPQNLLFLAFAFAFAIKVPLFPLHTWLPDAHVEAPTAGSVILAGVLLKFGGYGFVRFAFPLFPEAVRYFQGAFMVLGAIAVVYGALVAMVQPDLKKMVAYSSVSHMGYVILGLFSLNALAISGSLFQMLSHGVVTGGLFFAVGMLYERRHTRQLSDFGGLARVMPRFAVGLMILTLSAIALPATSGFVGEFLILLGSWSVHPVAVTIAGLGVILGATYMLWMYQRVMFGPVKHVESQGLKDLSVRETTILAPLIVLIFVMGVVPNFFFKKMEPSVQRFVGQEMKWKR